MRVNGHFIFGVAFELVQNVCDFATRYATVKIQPALFEMTKWQYSGIEDGESMERELLSETAIMQPPSTLFIENSYVYSIGISEDIN